MTLQARFRWIVATSIATLIVLALLTTGAFGASARASDALAAAVAIQRTILERAGLRDEYLLFGEVRARKQWERTSARLVSQIDDAAALFSTPADLAALAEMKILARRGEALFSTLVTLEGPGEGANGPRAPASEFRDQITSKLVLMVYQLSSHASKLADAASVRSERTEGLARAAALVLVAAALAVMMAQALVTSRLLTRRIASLRAGAARIASGDLDHRIAMTGTDELTALGSAFDEMATQLQVRMAELKASNAELEAFAYSVSHDLRAPLRHMMGFVELLERLAPVGFDEKSRHYLGVIAGAARTMGSLVDDLLGFSRMTRTELMETRVDLGAQVDEAVAEISRSAVGPIEWRRGPMPEVAGDPAMLRQVWLNLLSNAVKFSRKRTPPRIEIGAETVGGEVRCFVRDNGVGFDARYAHKLFGVFQRLHRATEFEGNGIGLASVQRIVSRHRGRVWAESVLDQGAVFWFSLPAEGGK
jgi:signal transduction histidine kinase